MNATPEKLFLFWSYCPEWWARAIVYITGNRLPDKSDAWSHCGLGFIDADGAMTYWEAIVGEGFDGPKPMQKLIDKTSGAGCRLAVEETAITKAAVQAIHETCENWIGTRGYSPLQLVAMLFYERIGRWFGRHLKRDETKVVCSEAQARVVFPLIDLRTEGRNFDESNPNSTWRKWMDIKVLMR